MFLLVPLGAKGFNIALEHDLGTGSFVSAGALKVSKGSQKGRGVQVVLSRGKLSPSDRQVFEGLVESDGYYRLRIPGSSQKLDDSHSVVASVRARCLAEAKFQEYVVLHVDSRERIFSLDYSPLTQNCRPGLEANLSPDWNFPAETDVIVRKAAAAPVIDIPKLPREVGGSTPFSESSFSGLDEESGSVNRPNQPGEKGKKEEEKTWFEKNWMLVVFGGMLVLNVLGSVGQQMEPPPAEGGARPRPR